MQFCRNCEACSHLHNEQLRQKCAKSTQSAQIIFAQFLNSNVAVVRGVNVPVASQRSVHLIWGGQVRALRAPVWLCAPVGFSHNVSAKSHVNFAPEGHSQNPAVPALLKEHSEKAPKGPIHLTV